MEVAWQNWPMHAIRQTQQRAWSLWKRLPVRHRGALVLAIPLICLVATFGAWVLTRRSIVVAGSWVDHTQAILTDSYRLRLSLLNAETGIRGYVISGNPQFLVPYQTEEKELQKRLQRLQDATRDNPRQRARLQETDKAIQDKLEVLVTLQSNWRDNSVGPILIVPEIERLIIEGENRMDKIRQLLDVFEAEERSLLRRRQAANIRTQQWTTLLIGTLALVSLASCIGALLLFRYLERELISRADELSRLTAMLTQTNRNLEKQNQELDRFAYVASHDLKAPLRAIANLSEWIEEDIGELLPPDNRHQMELLRGRVYRLEALLNGLLDYSRIGRQRLEVEQVAVADVIADVIDTLSVTESVTEDVIITQDPNMPKIRTRPLLLWQVFNNLIGNAIKHNPNPKKTVHIAVAPAGAFYRFEVSDNGPGIAPEYHQKIFEIFQTLQARDTFESTGVGLAIIKKIIEAEGGIVGLEAKSGGGSTFYFTWPKH